MKLTKTSKLILKKLENGARTPSELAVALGISRANISMWKHTGHVPTKYFREIIKELNISKTTFREALHEDIRVNFK